MNGFPSSWQMRATASIAPSRISNCEITAPANFEGRSGHGNHRRVDGFIGGFRDGNQILSSDAVDEDERNSARRTLHALKIIDVDPFLNQTVPRGCPKGVGAISAKKCDCSARPSSRDCLVRTFTAAEHLKVAAENRFPRMRQAIAKDHHVSI